MKKIFLSAAILGFIGIGSVNAETKFNTKKILNQDSISNTNQDSTSTAIQVKKEVSLSDLTESIKKTLSDDSFKGWVPTTSYYIKDNNQEYYLIDLKKLEEVKSIKINTTGTIID
jgi:hypothetical protein